jgi:hypothetical protein
MESRVTKLYQTFFINKKTEIKKIRKVLLIKCGNIAHSSESLRLATLIKLKIHQRHRHLR